MVNVWLGSLVRNCDTTCEDYTVIFVYILSLLFVKCLCKPTTTLECGSEKKKEKKYINEFVYSLSGCKGLSSPHFKHLLLLVSLNHILDFVSMCAENRGGGEKVCER